MLQDLATVAPSVIVCAVFLFGVIALLRHEMAPRRRRRAQSQPDHGDGVQREDAGHSEL